MVGIVLCITPFSNLLFRVGRNPPPPRVVISGGSRRGVSGGQQYALLLLLVVVLLLFSPRDPASARPPLAPRPPSRGSSWFVSRGFVRSYIAAIHPASTSRNIACVATCVCIRANYFMEVIRSTCAMQGVFAGPVDKGGTPTIALRASSHDSPRQAAQEISCWLRGLLVVGPPPRVAASASPPFPPPAFLALPPSPSPPPPPSPRSLASPAPIPASAPASAPPPPPPSPFSVSCPSWRSEKSVAVCFPRVGQELSSRCAIFRRGLLPLPRFA